MYIAGPAFVKTQTGSLTPRGVGGALVHARESGVADFVVEGDDDCLKLIRELLSYLPSNNREKPWRRR